MKLVKCIVFVAIFASLVACGHSYDGEYEASIMGGIKQKLVFGSENYIEQMGVRSNCDDAVLRESGDENYVICKLQGQEMAFKVIDNNTLVLDGGIITIKYHRLH